MAVLGKIKTWRHDDIDSACIDCAFMLYMYWVDNFPRSPCASACSASNRQKPACLLLRDPAPALSCHAHDSWTVTTHVHSACVAIALCMLRVVQLCCHLFSLFQTAACVALDDFWKLMVTSLIQSCNYINTSSTTLLLNWCLYRWILNFIHQQGKWALWMWGTSPRYRQVYSHVIHPNFCFVHEIRTACIGFVFYEQAKGWDIFYLSWFFVQTTLESWTLKRSLHHWGGLFWVTCMLHDVLQYNTA